MSTMPLCFVLMPFGSKKDQRTGQTIDFDQIYSSAIAPAIEGAGLQPIRADEELAGGIIHKPMFERLMLCEFAVADLTTANANVFYELGVRHAVRSASTQPIFAEGQQLPFDVNFLRALPYTLGAGGHFGEAEANALKAGLQQRLQQLRQQVREDGAVDSPIFQLLNEYRAPEISRLKTDVFREQVRYAADMKAAIARARQSEDAAALKEIEGRLGDLDGVEAGVLVDVFLSWRALGDWSEMVSFCQRMPGILRQTVLVQEQLGFALNRLGERQQALDVLTAVADRQGPSSETSGLIGRIYKDMWGEAKGKGRTALAAGLLDRAIENYLAGYYADFRDAYPGINAVTLLDIKGTHQSLAERDRILPVVRFAVQQRLADATPDYWDYATLLELAVLSCDPAGATAALGQALANQREPWEAGTTANNLRLIKDARQERGQSEAWLIELLAELEPAA